MGRLLALGICYREAKTGPMAVETVEGANLALTIGPAIEMLIEQGSSLPLAQATINAICHDRRIGIP